MIRILYLEDDDFQRRIGVRLLKLLGHHVTACASADEARQKFRESNTNAQGSYDLLVFDLDLGDKEDGLAVYKSLKEMHPGQRCLIVSGSLGSDQARKAVETAGCCSLPKPCDKDRLKAAIEAALS